MIRAFVAIPVPREVRAVLEKAQGGLHTGNHVAPENFHVTLAFLDEHPENVIDDVIGGLNRISHPPFYLEVEGLGTFGKSSPTSLYADVKPAQGLKDLHKKVRQAVRDGGVPIAHARFVPHITLARFGSGLVGADLKQMMSFLSRRAALSAGPFPVTEFHLYESKLGKSGPTYTVLDTFPLTGV